MDPRQFDRLVQSLGRATSRRDALFVFLTGMVAPFWPSAALGKGNRKRKRRGRHDGDDYSLDGLAAEGRKRRKGKGKGKKKRGKGGNDTGGGQTPPPASRVLLRHCAVRRSAGRRHPRRLRLLGA
jgi:hypothetical protein